MSLEAVHPAVSSFSNRTDKASKAFSTIDSQRALLSACTTQWQELEQYFYDIEYAVQEKFLELAERERAFESKISESIAALDKREDAVSSRGESSLASLQKQKDSAITAYSGDKTEAQAVAEEDLDNSASIAVVSDLNVLAVKPGNSVNAGSAVFGGSSVSTSLATASAPPKVASEVTVRPELKTLCEKMDCDGLRNFVVEHRKDINSVRNELVTALHGCADPCLLVLKAVEGYHAIQLNPSHAKETEAAIRRSCILLLECLAQALASPVVGKDHLVDPSNVKESVKVVAKRWGSRMDENKIESPLDAHAFLQLLATFGIAAEFPDDDLCKFITLIARRKQTPALCRSLGLTAKVPGLLDMLIKDGKQMEALAFAHAFGLMERLQPVPMLKSYLNDACKEAETCAKGASHEAAGQYDAALKELFAIRAVINAVEEYNLGSQYPTQDLQKRVVQLEKEKVERKRAALAIKQQAKKPRTGRPGGSGIVTHHTPANGGVGHENSTFGQAGILSGRAYHAHADVGQYGGPAFSSFGQASQTGCDGRPEAVFGSTYAVGNRSSLSLSNSYQYPYSDIVGSSLFRPTSAVYSNYQFGGGLTPNSYLR